MHLSLSAASGFHDRSIMPQSLQVHLLPSLIEPGSLQDGTAVIIDILRASSTIITALHHGALRVVPCGTPEEALRVKQHSTGGSVLLGGERGGVRIAAFDLGNSPAEYRPDVVTGKTVAFTTTNGTRALLTADSAHEILIGAFLNRQAIVKSLHREHRPTHLICAGTDGVITGEDVLFAGAIVEALLQAAAQDPFVDSAWALNDSAMIALGFWKHLLKSDHEHNPGMVASEMASPGQTRLSEFIQSALKKSRGGENLSRLGYDSDIMLCSQLDTIDTIPRYVHSQHCLVVADEPGL